VGAALQEEPGLVSLEQKVLQVVCLEEVLVVALLLVVVHLAVEEELLSCVFCRA
jgi:hypothetical protein